jgi:hydroxysqualene synthase
MPMPHATPAPKPALRVDHYENFPVASLLCPKRLRAPIAAIYWFARTADDLADEGSASSEARLQDLAAYRKDLSAAAAGQVFSTRWPGVFTALQQQMRQHALPAALLHDLLSAFEQDVRHTAAGHWYASHNELLAYCQRSANPVGRLLLHLYGLQSGEALSESDAVCSALQLINFWQDLRQDLPRQRYYLPLDLMRQHGVRAHDLLPTHAAAHAATGAAPNTNTIKLIAACADLARASMLKGLQLPKRVQQHLRGFDGWRAALELRCVIHGGLRVLEKMKALHYNTLQHRPKLGTWDALVVLLRALLRQSPQ